MAEHHQINGDVTIRIPPGSLTHSMAFCSMHGGPCLVIVTVWRCLTCRHFEPYYKRPEVKWGSCLRHKTPGSLMDPAVVYDDGDLAVSPEFGCVQWESKEKPPGGG